ncbi:efflux RND transporter periplasmic adaptor subunit [Alteromonas facilis]|uniref:efflux RND transporter periplasmic adaptor subunit n=1 Tax=Alteromonas facilis TaxID=2048004 RepID=UPI000C28520A|nr:efflux RND transporter periplasmic adaptor subunit [Alteromonas facilis]
MNKLFVKILVPILILVVGVGLKFSIEASAPEEKEEELKDTRPTVRTQTLNAIDYTVTIESFGEVQPLESTNLSAQVSGEVVTWNPNFVAGGIVKRGETLFSIEKDAYESALLQAEAELSQAKALLIEEKARAEVAAKEAKALSSKQVSDLYLRKPQVMSAEASVKSAEARLRIAKRDLNNTNVTAPYDALVVSRNIGVGQFVQTGASVATLHNIEIAEVVFPIAGFDNEYLPAALAGQPAQVITRGRNAISRSGVIARDLGIVDEATRMTNLVVRIPDPYGLNSDVTPLKFGNYVEVSFDGSVLQDVFKVKQDLVNNNIVWTLDDEGKMQKRRVDVIREQGDFFLVKAGLTNGDRIIMTLPEYPQNGMEVIVVDENTPTVAASSD